VKQATRGSVAAPLDGRFSRKPSFLRAIRLNSGLSKLFNSGPSLFAAA
jgi:hypothetical protein